MIIKYKAEILKGFGYFCYAAVLFIVLVYIKFPYDALKDHLTAKVEHAISKHVYIKKIFPVLPAGVGIRQIVVKDSLKKSGVTIFSAEEIQAKAVLRSLFFPEKKVNFFIKAYGGDISGDVKLHNNRVKVHTRFKGIDTEKFPIKELKIMADPVHSRLTGNGEADFVISGKKISEGVLSFNIDRGIIDRLVIYSFALPEIHYSNISSAITIKNDRVYVKKFSLKAKEMEIEADGDIFLHKALAQSRVKLKFRFKVSSVYLKSVGVPPGMFSRRKDSKGFTTVNIIGTLGKPRMKL